MSNTQNHTQKRRQIDVFIYNGMNILDVAGPVQAFSTAKRGEEYAYKHRYLSIDGAPITACCGMRLHADGVLGQQNETDDLLVPGGNGVDRYLANDAIKNALGRYASSDQNNRIISICSGALLLADAGLLDGLEATTHWGREAQSKEQFPLVDWNLDKIYIAPKDHHRKIYTSAGVTTGIDLALSIIAQDLGAKAALEVARELVVYLKRSGGQSQFSNYLIQQYEAKSSGIDGIARLVGEINQQPTHPWTLDAMAHFAAMNARTLTRRFQSQFATTPAEFVEQVRIDKARELLSQGLVLKQVASTSGFGDVQRMRRAFKRRLGVTLQDYVKGFG
ncbi:MAG: helix-turn-helix domain-containing protein [Lentilitoribacter sp.]